MRREELFRGPVVERVWIMEVAFERAGESGKSGDCLAVLVFVV